MNKTPAKTLARWKTFCDANREHVREANRRAYWKYRKERLDDKREYFAQNKDAILARRRANIQCVLANRLRWQVWRALDRCSRRKEKSLVELLGCSLVDFRAHIESLFKDGMTWENRGQWHIDHIRPIASFDLTDPAQQGICFHFSNLQPLWATANHQKGAKWSPDETR